MNDNFPSHVGFIELVDSGKVETELHWNNEHLAGFLTGCCDHAHEILE